MPFRILDDLYVDLSASFLPVFYCCPAPCLVINAMSAYILQLFMKCGVSRYTHNILVNALQLRPVNLKKIYLQPSFRKIFARLDLLYLIVPASHSCAARDGCSSCVVLKKQELFHFSCIRRKRSTQIIEKAHNILSIKSVTFSRRFQPFRKTQIN